MQKSNRVTSHCTNRIIYNRWHYRQLFLFFLFNDTFLGIIFIGATLVEGMRKIMKVILHLTFMHTMRISIELGTLISYLALFWGPYFLLNIPPSLYSLFIPFFIASLMSCGILALYLYYWYFSLPQAKVAVPPSLAYRIIRMRLYTSLYSIGHQLFSSNILIPYIALHSGFAQAGIWNLIQTITNTITNVMHKISGFTSQALLSHVKDQELAVKQKTFSVITNTLNQIVYAIIVFVFINYHKLSFIHNNGFPEKEWLIAPLLYIGITIVEQWSLAYEKFYMNEERTGHLIIFNTLIIISCLFLMRAHYSLTTFLTALFILRISSFLLLALVSYYLWGIKPDWRIKPRYFIMAVILAVAVYLYLHYLH